MNKPVGKTKDVGFQFGLRKTFSVSANDAWDFMFSNEGLNTWLGSLKDELEIKKPFTTMEGIEGLVRVLKPYSHIRMNWKKPDWENMSTVQIRVMGNAHKATIAIHQEKLLDSAQREEMKEYWQGKMEEISKQLD
ncbi:MAG: ATPase [Bacteroidia bacterium]